MHAHDCACFVRRSIADGKTHVLCSTFSRTLQPRPLQRALRADRRAHVVCLRRCLHDVDRPRCWHGHRRLVQRLAPAVLALLLLVGGRGSSRFLAGASEPLEVARVLPMPTHTGTVRVIAMHVVQHVACSHHTPQHAPLRTAPARWFPTTGAAGSRAGTRPKTEVGCTGGAVDTRGCAGDEQTNRQADTPRHQGTKTPTRKGSRELAAEPQPHIQRHACTCTEGSSCSAVDRRTAMLSSASRPNGRPAWSTSSTSFRQ